jgi:circadian clock protein KaiB
MMATARPRAVRLGRVKRAKVRGGNTTARQAAVAAGPDAAHYRLRLFVTGTTPRSARAIQNLRSICEDHLQGRYDLEVIDIYQHPEHVKAEQIVVTPTLVKQFPLPVRKLIGDLSDKERVLAALDIEPRQISPTLPKNEHAA